CARARGRGARPPGAQTRRGLLVEGAARLRHPRRPAPLLLRRHRAAGRLMGASARISLLLPPCVRRQGDRAQRAPRAGRRLAGDAVPGDTRRCGNEAGADRLPVPPLCDLAHPAARVQRRDEHRGDRGERRARTRDHRADGANALVRQAPPSGCRRAAGLMPYASVYPLVTARAVARPFTYEVPEDVAVGAIVRVPFGRSRARAIVTELVATPPDGVDARPIDGVVGAVPPALVELALWLADYYGSTPARALALVAPETPKRRKEQAPPAERQALRGEAAPAELSEAQRVAVARIVDGRGGNLLLHGVTGSGKTEVYLQACASMLERGFGAIVLVPEIALAPQTVGRVRARFGDRVAILHSALTDAERRDERERIASGEA